FHAARRATSLHAAPIRRASAGLFVEPSIEDWSVGVNAAVAQEGPVLGGFFGTPPGAIDDGRFFFFAGGFWRNLPGGNGVKGRSPEFDSGIGRAFVTDAIHCGNVDPVRDRVGTLNRLPGIELRSAILRFFTWMPADCGWIKQNIRAPERRKARAFGIPLIPTH